MKKTGCEPTKKLCQGRKFDRSVIFKEIETLLATRGRGKTICPSEVARRLDSEHWRDHLKDVHDVVDIMIKNGLIMITQKGKETDPSKRKGAYRIKKI